MKWGLRFGVGGDSTGADGVGVELAGEVSNAASYSLFNAAGAGEEGREGDRDGGWGAQRRRPIKFIQFALQFELFQCSGRSEWLNGCKVDVAVAFLVFYAFPNGLGDAVGVGGRYKVLQIKVHVYYTRGDHGVKVVDRSCTDLCIF